MKTKQRHDSFKATQSQNIIVQVNLTDLSICLNDIMKLNKIKSNDLNVRSVNQQLTAKMLCVCLS